MNPLTIAEFDLLVRTIWPYSGEHTITHEEALLKLSHWQHYTANHRYFYRDASWFWRACNAAGLFDVSPIAGARRYALYQLNERGRQFHARLGALLAGRLLARHVAAQRDVQRALHTAKLRMFEARRLLSERKWSFKA